MKKTVLCAVLCFAALIAALSGCGKNKETAFSVKSDASISGFEWGTEKNSVDERCASLAEKQSFAVNTNDNFTTLEGCTFFDSAAIISFHFSSFGAEDCPALEQNSPLLLTGANIVFKNAEKADVTKKLCDVLGAQETKKLTFFNEAGSFGYRFDGDLDEAQYYWHGEKNLIEDLGADRLREVYSSLSEEEIVKMFHSMYPYIVRIWDASELDGLEDGSVLISITADAKVLRDFLAA